MARAGDPADLRMFVVLLRAVRKWTQEELSKASGVDRGLISDYELGKKAPTLRTVERLAKGAGISPIAVETLLTLLGSMCQVIEGSRRGEQTEPMARFIREVARAVGEGVETRLTPYSTELEAMVWDEGED